jgi:hypothetical protein
MDVLLPEHGADLQSDPRHHHKYRGPSECKHSRQNNVEDPHPEDEVRRQT